MLNNNSLSKAGFRCYNVFRVIFSIIKRKGADSEKHGVGTFWACLGFTLPDSLDMIKIENVFTCLAFFQAVDL